MLGREIADAAQGMFLPGSHRLAFNADDLPGACICVASLLLSGMEE